MSRRGIEIANTNQPTVAIDDRRYGNLRSLIDPQDSQCNAEGGVATGHAFHFGSASIVAVIGPMCSSGCAPPPRPIYDAAGYSTISPYLRPPAALTRSGFTSFNRTASP